VAVTLTAAGAHAADIPPRVDVAPSTVAAPPVLRQNSVFVFAGAMSTTDMMTTMGFNLTANSQPYDNWIIGAAYQRDLWYWRGFVVGAEIGVADRFGQYRVCCDTIVRSSSLVHSGELFGGAVLRHEGFLLFNSVRIGAGITVGLSATTNSIGREREREISRGGNARLLFYLGPELTFSTPAWPDLDLVMRLHHRSGAMSTLGNLEEGYNAYVFGVRWRF
jgi:hypothetical protein